MLSSILIDDFKEMTKDNNYTYEASIETITRFDIKAILLKVGEVYTQSEVKVGVLKYFFVYNRKIFELIITYPLDDYNNELENEIESVLNLIEFS